MAEALSGCEVADSAALDSSGSSCRHGRPSHAERRRRHHASLRAALDRCSALEDEVKALRLVATNAEDDPPLAERFGAVKVSMATHRLDCLRLREPVRNPTDAALKAGGPDMKRKLGVHLVAGLAKHAQMESSLPLAELRDTRGGRKKPQVATPATQQHATVSELAAALERIACLEASFKLLGVMENQVGTPMHQELSDVERCVGSTVAREAACPEIAPEPAACASEIFEMEAEEYYGIMTKSSETQTEVNEMPCVGNTSSCELGLLQQLVRDQAAQTFPCVTLPASPEDVVTFGLIGMVVVQLDEHAGCQLRVQQILAGISQLEVAFPSELAWTPVLKKGDMQLFSDETCRAACRDVTSKLNTLTRAVEIAEAEAEALELSACEKDHKVENVMQWRGLEPNVLTYTTHISACEKLACKKGRKAEKAFAKRHKKEKAMELDADSQQPVECHRPSWADIAGGQVTALCVASAGSEPNVTTYFDKAESACEKSQVVKAMAPHAVLQQRAIISACEKGQADKAIELFIDMQVNGLELMLSTYAALLSACEKGHRAEKAMELFDDRSTFSALLSAYGKGFDENGLQGQHGKKVLAFIRAWGLGAPR